MCAILNQKRLTASLRKRLKHSANPPNLQNSSKLATGVGKSIRNENEIMLSVFLNKVVLEHIENNNAKLQSSERRGTAAGYARSALDK